MNNKDLARYIDHTLLKADARHAEIVQHCGEAQRFGFYSVCVQPIWVRVCRQLLKDVKVCTVIGFPTGAHTAPTKAFEAREAVLQGADELDMVVNLGALKSGAWGDVKEDIKAVVQAAGSRPVKVILETSLLTDAEKRQACQVAEGAGAAFVKTSTGFVPGGATLADVRLMHDTVGGRLGVKASGGIRDLKAIRDFIAAGATRIGTSSGAKFFAGDPSPAEGAY